MAEHRSTVEIAAPPSAVFDHLVDERRMTSWMGTWARLEPVAQGEFSVDIAGYPVRGRYLEVDRPRRVVVSWGFAGSRTLPPGSSTVTFELTPTEGGTLVELVHSDLPDDDVDGHRDGWEHFLPRLARAATGAAPPHDEWSPQRATRDPGGTRR